MKDKLKMIPTCRNPHDFNNPLKVIQEYLEERKEKDPKEPPKVKIKVIY